MKQWVKERDECLETRDVNNLIAFMEKWSEKGFYDKTTIQRFKHAPENVQLGTLCKCIMNATKVSRATKKWAKAKLKELGMSAGIY